jgi:polysaccharide biosynthesis transport protein
MMTSAQQAQTAGAAHNQGGLSLDDIYFTIFRHKWLILGCLLLGICAAAVVRVIRPPLYESKAKLMVLYVVNATGVNLKNPGEEVRQLDAGGMAAINAEIEILTSLDVAAQAADAIGPERILAKLGGGNDRMAAAGVVLKGTTVEPTRTQILSVSYKHRDPDLSQPILRALITAYQHKHQEVHQGLGVLDDYYARQRDELSKDLARTEEELKRLKTEAGVVSLEETKKAYQNQVSKWQEELLSAEGELAQRKAMLGDVAREAMTATAGSTAANRVPPEKVEDYGFVSTELENLRRRERELSLQFKEAYPLVQSVRAQVAKLSLQRSNLVAEFPALAQLTPGMLRGSTNAAGGGIGTELNEVKRLTAKVEVLGAFLTNLQAKVSRVLEYEPKINQVQRQRDLNETNYQFFVQSLRQAQMGESLAAGKVLNMNVLQEPTPPLVDYKKLLKLVGIAFGGCVGMGLGLAFALDMVLDRTVRRRTDVEKHLRVPVFLTIPDMNWSGGLRFGRDKQEEPTEPRLLLPPAAESGGEGVAGLPILATQASNSLQGYADGLRERVMTFFSINNMDMKKPKLVAVTGCARGAGVSTLATGLAASLSKTGDGNVLLVDMNQDQGVAHSFYKGRPGCGLTDVLEPESRADAQVQEKLFLAAIGRGENDKMTKVEATRFTQIVPRLKASDYDYIIFDMPPVTQTSVTPRLASHMDITLLVLESEKTGQQAATRATALMKEARCNVAAVLNKFKPHVPQELSQEL